MSDEKMSFTAIDMTKTKTSSIIIQIVNRSNSKVLFLYVFRQVIMYACMLRHLDPILQTKSISFVLFDDTSASFTISYSLSNAVSKLRTVFHKTFVKLLKYAYDKPGTQSLCGHCGIF